MSNIIAINGSPKAKESVSGLFISKIEEIAGAQIPAHQAIKLVHQDAAVFAELLKCDALLLVFPLYVDHLPSPLISVLTSLERAAKAADGPLPTVFALCNCGFFEATHTRLALDIVRNFCHRAGLPWGYGVGVGGGGMVGAMARHMEKGPAANVYAALQALCQALANKNAPRDNAFVSPKFPRFLYKLGGHIGWKSMAKKNGVKKSLAATPHERP